MGGRLEEGQYDVWISSRQVCKEGKAVVPLPGKGIFKELLLQLIWLTTQAAISKGRQLFQLALRHPQEAWTRDVPESEAMKGAVNPMAWDGA